MVPVLLKGLTVNPADPFFFEFLVDTGDSGLKAGVDDEAIRKEGEKLARYFLASLTLPEKDQWVNLSPYEKDRMMTGELGETELGRDMLAQDYLLKQLTASFLHPDKGLGREFWQRVYAKADLSVLDIPANAFNKVWVVAEKADIFVKDRTVFVVNGHLKVLLESDYLAMRQDPAAGPNPPLQDDTDRALREVVVPEIEREVNEGANFANLRQVFYSVILATWYKRHLKESLLTRVYADKAKTAGVGRSDSLDPQAIYDRYVAAYKKGVVNLVRDDPGPDGESVPRRYFSGGEVLVPQDFAMSTAEHAARSLAGDLLSLQVRSQRTADVAQIKTSIYNDAEAAARGEQAPGGALFRAGVRLAGMAFIFGTGNNGFALDKHGNPVTDDGAIMELGHSIVLTPQGWVFRGRDNRGRRPELAAGESSFEQNFNGLGIARRFSRILDADRLIEAQLSLSAGETAAGLFELINRDLPVTDTGAIVRQKDAVDRVLRAITTALLREQETDVQASQVRVSLFVRQLAFDIGQALSSLLAQYHAQAWVRNFIMVSGIGENFAKPEAGSKLPDIFVSNIRTGVFTGLTSRGITDREAEEIADGVRRSSLTWQREVMAAALTGDDLEALGVGAGEAVYSLGYSVGGTKIGVAVLDRNGNIVYFLDQLWVSRDPALFIQEMIILGQKALQDKSIDRRAVIKTGVSFAGPVNAQTGVIGPDAPPNLPFLLGYNLPEEFRSAWANTLPPGDAAMSGTESRFPSYDKALERDGTMVMPMPAPGALDWYEVSAGEHQLHFGIYRGRGTQGLLYFQGAAGPRAKKVKFLDMETGRTDKRETEVRTPAGTLVADFTHHRGQVTLRWAFVQPGRVWRRAIDTGMQVLSGKTVPLSWFHANRDNSVLLPLTAGRRVALARPGDGKKSFFVEIADGRIRVTDEAGGAPKTWNRLRGLLRMDEQTVVLIQKADGAVHIQKMPGTFEVNVSSVPADAAMRSGEAAFNTVSDRGLPPGGIDMNTSRMDMSQKGTAMDMTFDPALLEEFRRGDFSGIRPVALSVTPLDAGAVFGIK
jgi:predicted NBD/HSP70 family sugar kinase